MPRWQVELNTIAARFARQYPKEKENLSFKLNRPGLMGDLLRGVSHWFDR
jgi:hypothetical protein